MNDYAVLNPWAETDPVGFRQISPRMPDLAGKTVGLFSEQYKIGADLMLSVVEQKLKQRFPTSKFSWFECHKNVEMAESGDKDRFDDWIKGIDVAVSAVGD
ncbi:MAG: hypothetical protein HYX90_07115 [Chloroflexi bacterium]|nr:hypothetical protein [Chloroflexota bacterium]